MASADDDGPGRFAERFEQLLDSIRREDGERYSFPEIVSSIKAKSGFDMTSSYLSRILSGVIKNPGSKHTAAIADFFGVDARFFSSDKIASRGLAEIGLLLTMRDRGMEDIFLRATKLSTSSLEALRTQVKTLEQLEQTWRGADDLRKRPRRRSPRDTEQSGEGLADPPADESGGPTDE